MAESAFGVDHGDVEKAFGSFFKQPKMGGAAGARRASGPASMTTGPKAAGGAGGQRKKQGQGIGAQAKAFAGSANRGMKGANVPTQGNAAGFQGIRFGNSMRTNRRMLGAGAGGLGVGGAGGYMAQDGRNKKGQIK